MCAPPEYRRGYARPSSRMCARPCSRMCARPFKPLPGRRRWFTRGYHRVGHLVGDLNYGAIDIDWVARTVDMRVVRHDGAVPLRHQVHINDLQPDAADGRHGNGCPLEAMHYLDAWRWHLTIMAAILLSLVVPVTSTFCLASCLKRRCCPDYRFDDGTEESPSRALKAKSKAD